MKEHISLSAAACCLLAAASAFAEGSVGLSSSFERVETISHTTLKTTTDGVEQTSNSWRAGLGTGGVASYSVPRVGVEYSFESGLSLGAAVSFIVSFSDKISPNVWLLEPRVGYQFEFSDAWILWPRLGLTLHEVEGPDISHSALSLDVPLMRFNNPLGSFTVGPFLDIGLGGGNGATDQTLTEFGLGMGFQLR
jgi:hypothetical protein